MMMTRDSMARLALGALVASVLGSIGCASHSIDEAASAGEEPLAACTSTVSTNTYAGADYWGTITFKNGSTAVTGITVDFDIATGAHCTNDSVPTGAKLSPLNGSGASATTQSNHCTFTFAGVTLAANATKTFNYSSDSSGFTAAKNVSVKFASCSGSGGGGGGPLDAGAPKPPVDAGTTPPPPDNFVWRKASKTNFTSYPAPGSDECVKYSGCLYEGEFAALDGVQPLSWVKSHNIAAVHSKDFNKYKLHNLRLRSGTKTIDVVVYDECADSDCSGCCTQNAQPSGYLIDLESFTDARFGVQDGQIEWACIDPGCN